MLHFLPDSRSDIFSETIHELAGDGIIHAHDEAVVDLAGFGAFGLRGTMTEAAEIQESFLNGMGEGEGAAHLATLGNGDAPVSVGLAGMEPEGLLHGLALGPEHPTPLGLQGLLDEPLLDTHYSRTISI